jgi:anion-transporting  ArsA/GET3 family ATPase
MTRGESPLVALLAARDVVVFSGPGGVGKTTVSASAGLLAARELGRRVLVLTVDPARRLATSLGVQELGNAATRVDIGKARGELWAAMLDTKQSWDALIHRHCQDPATREAILSNPLYRNIAGKFVQSHDYIAMERLFEIHTSGQYDLVLLDTPPSAHATDLLAAPKRMADFFSSRLLRWLVAPSRSRFIALASRPFYQVADRLLGTQFLSDITEFFALLGTMHDGFVARARDVDALLHDRRTSFVVVTSLEPGPLAEAESLTRKLREAGYRLGALIANRTLPAYLSDPGNIELARELQARSEELAKVVAIGDASAAAGVLGEVARSFADFSMMAQAEAQEAQELATFAAGSGWVTLSIPILDRDVCDLDGLSDVAGCLAGRGQNR